MASCEFSLAVRCKRHMIKVKIIAAPWVKFYACSVGLQVWCAAFKPDKLCCKPETNESETDIWVIECIKNLFSQIEVRCLGLVFGYPIELFDKSIPRHGPIKIFDNDAVVLNEASRN